MLVLSGNSGHPETDMPTAGEIIERNARCFPQRQAVICGERRLTHAELALRAPGSSLQRGMRKGCGAGERIAILAMNGIEYLEVYAAVEVVRPRPEHA